MVSALERVIAFNERHRVSSNGRKSNASGDWTCEAERPRKQARLTPDSDPASQSSSQSSAAGGGSVSNVPVRPPFPRSSPPSGNITKPRLKPDAYTASQPLLKVHEEDTSLSFWQGAIICFWGWINPPRRPSDAARTVHRCSSYDDLPIVWRTEFDTYAYKQGASCVVGYGAGVFESVYELVKTSPRPVRQCIHICRLRNGRSNLRRGWLEWKNWRKMATAEVGQCQLETDLLCPNMDSEVPDGNQIVATIFWLHWSTRHRKGFLVNDIPFCQVPTNEKVHAASLMQGVSLTQGASNNLRVLILGGTDESVMDDIDLWRQALRVSLGADVIMASALDKVFEWESIRTTEKVQFQNAMSQFLSFPVVDTEDKNLPQIILCLKTRFLVPSLLPMTGEYQEALNRLGALIEAGVPFVKPSWFIECYQTSSLVDLTEQYLLNSRAIAEYSKAVKHGLLTETTTAGQRSTSSATEDVNVMTFPQIGKRDSTISENWWDSGLFVDDPPPVIPTPPSEDTKKFSQALIASPMLGVKARFSHPRRQLWSNPKPGVVVPGWECLGRVPKLLIALTPDICMTYPSLGTSCLEHFPVTNSLGLVSIGSLALHTFLKTIEAHLSSRLMGSLEIPRPQKYNTLLEELEQRLTHKIVTSPEMRPLLSLLPVTVTLALKDKAPSTWKVDSLEDEGDVSQTTVITYAREMEEYQQAIIAIARNVDLCLRSVPSEGWFGDLSADLEDSSSPETMTAILFKEIAQIICERSLSLLVAACEGSVLSFARSTHSLISMTCQRCPIQPSRIRRLVSVEDLKEIPVDEFNTRNVAKEIFHGEGIELTCEEGAITAMLSSLGRWMAPSICRKLKVDDSRTEWAARNFYNLLDSQKTLRDPDLPYMDGPSQSLGGCDSQVVASDGVMKFVYNEECLSLRTAAEDGGVRLERLIEMSWRTYEACVRAMEEGGCIAAAASEAEKLLTQKIQ